MARTRLINPAAPVDEDVARLSMAGRLLWAYLPCHADREGRLKDSAFTLRAAIFPGDQVDVDALLSELAAARHITRYEVDGRRFIQIRNFAKYQSPHKNEAPSSIPGPSDTVLVKECREASGNSKSTRSPPVSDPDPVPEDLPLCAPARDRSTTDGSPPAEASGVPAPSAGMLRPPRQPPAPYPLGAKSLLFLEVFELYPRGDGKNEAARVWQEVAATFPGGETALRDAILARFKAGQLSRAPYKGEHKFRPMFETYLLEARWEDGESKPDDAEPKDPRCAFHRAPGTGRHRPPNGFIDGCPDCKHTRASRSERASEPTSSAAATDALLARLKPPERIASPEEIAEIRRGPPSQAAPVAAKAGVL